MRKSLNLFVLALVLLSIPTFSIAAETEADGAPAQSGVVNINTADATQLALLPRIGEKAAQRIIEYRTEHGPFKKPTELMQVKGVGAKTYEGLSKYVVIEGKTTLLSKVKSPRKPRANKPTSTASND